MAEKFCRHLAVKHTFGKMKEIFVKIQKPIQDIVDRHILKRNLQKWKNYVA